MVCLARLYSSSSFVSYNPMYQDIDLDRLLRGMNTIFEDFGTDGIRACLQMSQLFQEIRMELKKCRSS